MSSRGSFTLKTTKYIFFTLVALMIGVVGPLSGIMGTHMAAALSPITYYSIPFGDRPSYRPVLNNGPDGNMWFSEITTSKSNYGTTEFIARMTPSGDFSSFTLPFGWDFSNYGVDVGGIAAGSDGAIWFTDVNTNQIERLTTTGQFTNHYYVPSTHAYADVGSIESGPDGNLWFTMAQSHKIGRITTSGVFTEYPIPSGASPNSIATGPDGNMWFSEGQAGEIGKISMTGTITEYPVTSGAYVSSIVAGPDGNMWFTEDAVSHIGKISTMGVVTEYSTPVSNSVSGITVGSDGALWFLSFSNDNGTVTPYANNLNRITTDGIVSTYPVFGPSTSQPVAITGLGTGFDGSLWAADIDSNQLMRIDPLLLTAPPAPINLSIVSPTKQPVLNWDATTGATSYNIYRDGSSIGTSTSQTYTDSVAAEGSHSYYVTASNGTTESTASNSVTVSVDKTRPMITFVTPTSFVDPFNIGPMVTVNASDASGLQIMAIHVYTIANQLLTTCGSASASQLTAGSMSCSLAGLASGTYYIKAGVFDNAGNNTTILSGNFVIQ